MMVRTIAKVKGSLFGLFYVMTEGGGDARDPTLSAWIWTVFLLYVDVGQVLRVMTSTMYGWSTETAQFIRMFDLVWLVTDIVEKLGVPRFAYFAAAACVVLVALADTVYVAVIFSAGHVQKLWPVKLLKFLVASLVTILFSTLIKLVLIPIECLAEGSNSFSEMFKGESAVCAPWAFPQIIISVPSLILAAVYISFALMTSLMAFEINPLSRKPMASCTGSVEQKWLSTKVGTSVLIFLSPYVTPIAVCVVYTLLIVSTLHAHVKHLPFHSVLVNHIRGGVYTTIVWLSISCIVVAAHHENQKMLAQSTQWVLIALLPVSFLVGVVIVRLAFMSLERSLIVLSIEFNTLAGPNAQSRRPSLEITAESPQRTIFRRLSIDASGSPMKGSSRAMGNPQFTNGGDSPGAFKNKSGASFSWRREGSKRSQAEVIQTPPGTGLARAVDLVKRSMREAFFDATWETRKSFSTSVRARTAARVLLYKRNEADLPFLASVVQKGLKEHPDSTDLVMFHILLLRAVFCEDAEALQQEKTLKYGHQTFTFVEQYMVYALERRSKQNTGASKTGKGGGAVSAIHLMEFDTGMDKARKGHGACLLAMKQFWKVVKKKPSKTVSPDTRCHAQVEDMLMHLDNFDAALVVARKEYTFLMSKYPTSVTLLNAYAAFCDHVLNDWKQAEHLRKMVCALDQDGQGGCGEGDSAKGDDELEASANRSAATSENENTRSQIARYLSSVQHFIMGKQLDEVSKLHLRVKVAIVSILILASAGFVFFSFYLMSDIAKKNLKGVEFSGLFRAAGITGTFLLRSQHIAALQNQTANVASTGATIQGIFETVHSQHWENYDNLPSAKVADFYAREDVTLEVPVGPVWTPLDFSYWTLVNDFARRMQTASRASEASFKSPNFALPDLDDGKRSFVYVYENIFRNILPTFEDVADLYVEEVEVFGILARNLTIINTALNAFVVCCLIWVVMHEITFNMQNLQYRYVVCCFAISLPRTFANKIYMFYSEMDSRFRALEDMDGENRAEAEALLDTEFKAQESSPGGEEIEAAGEGSKGGRQQGNDCGGQICGLSHQGSGWHARLATLTASNLEQHRVARLQFPDTPPIFKSGKPQLTLDPNERADAAELEEGFPEDIQLAMVSHTSDYDANSQAREVPWDCVWDQVSPLLSTANIMTAVPSRAVVSNPDSCEEATEQLPEQHQVIDSSNVLGGRLLGELSGDWKTPDSHVPAVISRKSALKNGGEDSPALRSQARKGALRNSGDHSPSLDAAQLKGFDFRSKAHFSNSAVSRGNTKNVPLQEEGEDPWRRLESQGTVASAKTASLDRTGSLTLRNSILNMNSLHKKSSAKDLVRGLPDSEKRAVLMEDSLKKEVLNHPHWFTRKSVYLFVLLIVLGLSIFTFLYPARKMDELVNISSAFNLAGRFAPLASCS
mmetsp:Transcript_64872/g.159688  ORF Transcript_64872/g.159688 Transcript_64872/m.159688 type:complete len:1424 (+) Transcript_64872:141-4412(+)